MSTREARIDRGDDGTATVRFERHLRHPIERVWDALTDPDQVSVWFEEATIDPSPGGSVGFDFGDQGSASGQVRIWEPPRVLEYTWLEAGQESLVRWQLEPLDEGTHLVLVHQRLADAPEYAAGWHVFIDRLGVHLDDGDVSAVPDRYQELVAGYSADFGG